MTHKIVDNVLPKEIADNIFEVLTGEMTFPWFYMPYVVNKDTFDNQYMVHMFYDQNEVNSNFFNIIEPLVEIIKPRALWRIKANLYLATPTIIEHGFHVDSPWSDMHTAVYYVNNNNGYTALSDSTKIESVKNRLLILNPLVPHTSSTSTDNLRVTISFNWF